MSDIRRRDFITLVGSTAASVSLLQVALINLKATAGHGILAPPPLLVRADKVIK